MALTKTLDLTDNFGETIQFSDAYIRVELVSTTKTCCFVTYKIFREKAGQELQQKFTNFNVNFDGPNPIKQAYLHLKSLPEFADAVDC
jgi:hypothetical protein